MIVAIFNISLYIGTTSLDTYRPVPMSPMTAVGIVNFFSPYTDINKKTHDQEDI